MSFGASSSFWGFKVEMPVPVCNLPYYCFDNNIPSYAIHKTPKRNNRIILSEKSEKRCPCEIMNIHIFTLQRKSSCLFLSLKVLNTGQ